jgi:hypothetical protein
VGLFVGDDRSKISGIRFVDTQERTNVIGKEKPLFSVGELRPGAEITPVILVLLL